jgi:plastocyanin
MKFVRVLTRRRRSLGVAAVGAGALAAGLTAGGAFGALPSTAAFTVVDNAFQAQGDGGSATTIGLGGKVTFAYPSGGDEHNVRFTRDGVRCNQTDGSGGAINSTVVPSTPEEQGWAGECTFTQPGTYTFLCDVPEHGMKGTVTVVDETPPATTTKPDTPAPGTTTTTPAPAPGPGTTPTTVAPAAPGTVPPAPKVTVAKRQSGTAIRGTIVKGGARTKVAVDVRATRGSVRAPGRRSGRVSVGKASALRTSAAGRLSFAVALDARARAALKRARTLALDVRVTVTLPVLGAQTEAFRVVLRPAKARASAAAKARVTLKDTKFAPATVTVRKGGTVTWTWRDGDTPHDVVGSGFRSKVVSSGTFRHRFANAGTFRYICSIHPKMKGKVVVR